jgi:5-methylcytosine-specific restriction endonuclease McrA
MDGSSSFTGGRVTQYQIDYLLYWVTPSIAHGNTESEHGWEIDHIYPTALGGQTELDNLQPLNWQNNRAKGDTYPWRCGS